MGFRCRGLPSHSKDLRNHHCSRDYDQLQCSMGPKGHGCASHGVLQLLGCAHAKVSEELEELEGPSLQQPAV